MSKTADITPPLRSVYAHSSPGFSEGHAPSITVYPSGFLCVRSLDPDVYQEVLTKDVVSGDKWKSIQNERPFYTISSRAIAEISFYDDAVFNPSAVEPERAGKIIADWNPDKVSKISDGFYTPMMMITLLNGRGYLVAATQDGMDHALNVANQILNGTHKPEHENAAPLQKRRALNHRQRLGGAGPSPQG